MSNNALEVLDRVRRYDKDADDSQRGLVETGRICGIIGTVLLGLCLLLVFLRGQH
jgi:hypothetical protein